MVMEGSLDSNDSLRKDFRVIKSEWLWKRIEEEDITELVVRDDR